MPLTELLQRLAPQLERDEGRRHLPYVDTRGKITIGIGHNLTDKGLNDGQINAIWNDDMMEVFDSLSLSLPWFMGLSEARQGVLMNMGFNLGVVGLLAFHKTLGYMEDGDWNNAAEEMMRSAWATQVGSRATRLASQLRTDIWQ